MKLNFFKLILVLVFVVSSSTLVVGQSFSFSSTSVAQDSLGVDSVLGATNTYRFDASAFLSLYSGSSTNYNYLWSFGDGQYSTEENPTHTYSYSGSPTHHCVTLFATPIYVPMGPPPAAFLSHTQTISVTAGPVVNHPTLLGDRVISLSSNRMPRPGYESTFILTYKNDATSVSQTPFSFYYDDSQFDFMGFVAPNGETLVDNTPVSASPYNRKVDFTNSTSNMLAPDEERTIFIQLRAKEEVLGHADVLHSGAIDIHEPPVLFAKATTLGGFSSGPGSVMHEDEMSLHAVGSWDPNNKIASVQHISKNNIAFPKKIKYRINVENVGSSSTNSVTVVDQVSDVLDFSSFNYLGDKLDHDSLYITTNANSRQITFHFRKLGLSGTAQSPSVNLDDCQYWLDFEFEIDSIKFFEMFGDDCRSTDSIGEFGTKASIQFDNNSFITTNVASTAVYCEVKKDSEQEDDEEEKEEEEEERETDLISISNIFPNPTKGKVTVVYSLSDNINPKSTKTFLVNLKTNRQMEVNLDLQEEKGEYKTSLDMTKMRAGTYILVIMNSKRKFESSKIIKK